MANSHLSKKIKQKFSWPGKERHKDVAGQSKLTQEMDTESKTGEIAENSKGQDEQGLKVFKWWVIREAPLKHR